MKQFFFITILIWSLSSYSQSGFQFPEGVDKIEIPFQATYNLIVVPTIVNGVELNMILDTGASKSIIFNFSNIDSLSFKNGKLIKVGGYGERSFYNAYFSEKNQIEINGYKNFDSDLFIAAEKEINLRSTLGIDINGLLGFDFFKNALVEIDYLKEKIILYKKSEVIKSKLNKMTKVSIFFRDDKPYLKGDVFNGINYYDTDLLLDTGSGDALWLLKMEEGFKVNNRSFKDYLGVGMNGDIYGERSKVKKLNIGEFDLDNITVSIPSKRSANINENNIKNVGSLGGEVLRRFQLVFDYKNNIVYFKGNRDLRSGFFYNMAGIKIRSGEKELFVDIKDKRSKQLDSDEQRIASSRVVIKNSRLQYREIFRLFVDKVILNSPAYNVGLKEGDEIIGFNYKNKGSFSLNDLASRFYKNPYSTIRLRVVREGRLINFKIRLVPLI